MVVVDRLTKIVHLVPFPAIPSAEGAAVSFVRAVVRHHGLPDDIVSD
jgi:glycosylphosphatidylinositol phospholipase D